MNRFARALVSILLLLTAAAAVAEPAPEFTLPGKEGAVTLAGLRGKVVYVDFWASWCGPCRHSFPWMNELQAAYGDKGLAIVAINLDQERALADRFIETTKPRFTIAFDPEGTSAELYKVQGMPSSYIIDREGKIHARHLGFRESDMDKVEHQIRALLEAGK